MSHQADVRSTRKRLARLLVTVLKRSRLLLLEAGDLVRFIPLIGDGRRELGFADIDVPDSFFDPLPASELQYWSNCISPEDCV